MKLNTIALLCATVLVTGSAFANSSTTASDNWRSGHGNIQWKNVDGLCWRNANWTPATAAPGCDGGMTAPVVEVKKPAPAIVIPEPAVVLPVPAMVLPAPIVVAPAAPILVKPAAAPMKITLSADAFFETNKSIIKPAGKAKLDDVVAKLAGSKVDSIIAVGHTDSVGGDASNQKLSERRAQAVKAYLVSKGINAASITASGKGEKNPVATNKTVAGRAQNRRVDVSINGVASK